MVRVGGGWMALDEFLVKNDPCRGEIKSSPQQVTMQDIHLSKKNLIRKVIIFGSLSIRFWLSAFWLKNIHISLWTTAVWIVATDKEYYYYILNNITDTELRYVLHYTITAAVICHHYLMWTDFKSVHVEDWLYHTLLTWFNSANPFLNKNDLINIFTKLT